MNGVFLKIQKNMSIFSNKIQTLLQKIDYHLKKLYDEFEEEVRMSFKIAYLKSRNTESPVLGDFVEFAKERGAQFDFVTLDLNDIFPADVQALKQYDAILIQGAAYNREKVEDIARNLGLVTNCAFVEDFGNLTAQNRLFVTCISPKSLGEFRSTLKLGREATESIRHSELEIERAARHAYEFAEKRKKTLDLVTIHTLGVAFEVWYRVASEINEDYPSVEFDFGNCISYAVNSISGQKDYDVVLFVYGLFSQHVDLAEKEIGLEQGTSPIAYLGDTTVGMYGAHNPAAYSPRFDAISLAKMLENSFDLPDLAKDWQEHVKKEYRKIG